MFFVLSSGFSVGNLWLFSAGQNLQSETGCSLKVSGVGVLTKIDSSI